MSARLPHRIRTAAVAFGVLTLVALSWPVPDPGVTPAGPPTPFRWDAGAVFTALEAEFEEARGTPASAGIERMDSLETAARAVLGRVVETSAAPREELASLASIQFQLAVQGAAHAELLPRAEAVMVEVRRAVMRAAGEWDASRDTHEALYRLLFGGRIALEEALVQAGPASLPSLIDIDQVQSETPSIVVEGVRVHSGDILLSRGGAPTSALIARGSDFANTFSHAALAHVDPVTGEGTVVESLIETGTVFTSVEEFLVGKKHRVLVLRLGPDHPALRGDPQLPHRAASGMLARLRAEHLPYDFAMNWRDDGEVFCSEVVYHAYRAEGVELWTHRSAMTAPGLVRWLADMGVREFTTLVPSDLEYDPQLRAVVEWRNVEALMEYRIDNAITDALLEEADRGGELSYAWYALPIARLLKAASVAQGWMGSTPKIPTGMSASSALKVAALVSTVHPTLREDLLGRARGFEETFGFEAPYWTLVGLAREALADRRTGLAPSLRAR